jgi:hypothetical protein
MNKLLIKFFIALLAFAVSPFAVAEQKLDIVQIMGQFVQGEYAARKCSKPDEKTLAKFNSNFSAVIIRATEEMQKRKPGATVEQITDLFGKASAAVAKQIDDVLQTGGCNDPRIQDLLKRFEIQANLNF